jgi:hypothetical protein
LSSGFRDEFFCANSPLCKFVVQKISQRTTPYYKANSSSEIAPQEDRTARVSTASIHKPSSKQLRGSRRRSARSRERFSAQRKQAASASNQGGTRCDHCSFSSNAGKTIRTIRGRCVAASYAVTAITRGQARPED